MQRRLPLEVLEHKNCLSSVVFVEDSAGSIAVEPAYGGIPEFADLDGDRDLDLLVGGAGGIFWHENLDGKGQFAPLGREVGDSEHRRFCCVGNLAVDFDNDGDLDVVSYGRGQSVAFNHFVWHENLDGRGNYGGPHGIVMAGRRGSGPDLVVANDLDNDGAIDIVAQGWETIEIFHVDIDENVQSTVLVDQLNGSFGPSVLELSDVNRDGNLDIVFWVEDASNTMLWIENHGDGSYGAPLEIRPSGDLTQRIFTSVHSADIDGDGDSDLVSVMASDDFPAEGFQTRVAWLENIDGVGNYEVHTVFDSSGTQMIQLADFDGDGDSDILNGACAGEDCYTEISWFENIGDVTQFAERRHIMSSKDIVMAVGDIDGDFDFATTVEATNSVAFFENRKFGDPNNDGVFNSSDLVKVFQAAKYEDGILGNTTFDEGDWNQDGEFDSGDLVLAFQIGGYVAAAKAALIEPAKVDSILSEFDSDKALAKLDARHETKLSIG